MSKESPSDSIAAPPPANLKDPVLAAFLAWLIPGLGHWYQGRREKAVLYFVCILGIFFYGVYLGGNGELGYGRAVYYAINDEEWRLYYFCQMWVGLPALPALVQAVRESEGKEAYFMAPPRRVSPRADLAEKNRLPPTLHRLHSELKRNFDIATAYTMIAGLLNILAIYDAYAGPVIMLPQKRRKKTPESDAAPEKSDLEKAPSP
jgi:hypothetical protein